MKKLCVLSLALLLSLAMSGQRPSALGVEELTLSNGMTVWVNEDHSQPIVYGAVVVKAGAKDCPNTGIAHYFEHILFKGTEEIGTVDYHAEKPWLDSISACYDRLAATTDEAARASIQRDINRLSIKAGEYAIPNEFNHLISRYGGSQLNAGTSWDYTYYHNIFTPQYIEQWCLLNSDRLIRPVYRLFQSELEAVYEEKNMYADDMFSTVLDKVMAELFGDLPYAYPVIGSTENLKNPQLSAMQAFYGRYYVGCNMGLVLSGDVSASTLLPLLERTFGRIARGELPKRERSPLPDITEERTVEIKVPVPLVSVEALAFKSPMEFDSDANAMQVATAILYNEQAGLLDSLTNEGVLMGAAATTQSLNDAGVTVLIVVPNLLAKTSKAENACMEQLHRLCDGDFSDSMFETQKQEAYREAQRELETIGSRAAKMVAVMAAGRTWRDYLAKVEGYRHLTKDDVVAAARRYLKAPFVRFTKKNGDYAKDRISQPGYTPIVPKNAHAESAYAKRLATIPAAAHSPRLLDFKHDVQTVDLGGTATLYTADNPVNDLFELTLIYNRGHKADRRIEAATQLLNISGTDSLDRQQIERALQTLGASVTFESTNKQTSMLISGTDSHFDATLRLVAHLMTHVQPSAKNLNQVRDLKKADSKVESKDNREVMRALLMKMAYGDNSTYLTHLTPAETRRLSSEEMLASLDSVMTSACNIIYSGTLPSEDVAQSVRRHLPISRCSQPFIDYDSAPLGYDEPLVMVYDMPKSRQTILLTYEQIPPLPSPRQRALFTLFEHYFGRGMSSVLFQQVREFRSMAYSTQSMSVGRGLKTAPNSPLGFLALVGTQADKSMKAIALLDSLLGDMPLVEANFKTARNSVLNDIDASYPSFRAKGQAIANHRWHGYDEDPQKDATEQYPTITPADVQRFYDKHIRHNASHRVIGIVGNKDMLDMKTLAKYGRIIMLQKKDLFRK